MSWRDCRLRFATKERRRTNQPNEDGEEVIVANARGVGTVTMQLDWEVFNAELSHILSEKAVLLLTRRSWMTTPSRR